MNCGPEPFRLLDWPRRRRSGFSLVEMLVVIGVIVMVIGIVIPVIGSARRRASSVECQSHLRDLSIGFQQLVDMNDGFFPTSLDAAWDDLLLDYATDEAIFECPDDPLFQKTQLSYAWRDEFSVADPAYSLAGKARGNIRKVDLIVVFDAHDSWHETNYINAATIDGAAASYSVEEFDTNLQQPTTNDGPGLFDALK